MTNRAILATAFLASNGWREADRSFLAGDASNRRYERVKRGTKSAVFMDSPPGQGDDPETFLFIADHLASLGLSPPQCYAKDLKNGFLLLEDLGDEIYARCLTASPAAQTLLYTAATDVLIRVQNNPPPPGLLNFSCSEWAEAACLAIEWYRFAITGNHCDTAAFSGVLGDALSHHADGPRVMILRDYHAENLLWLPDRTGLARVGILDFQLAQLGQPSYDLVSLLQDARRDVRLEIEAAMVLHFVDTTGCNEAAFRTSYAVLGAQRALRILGIFARLCLKEGKPSYLKLLPRVWGQLQQNLANPALANLATICEMIPEPTPGVVTKIGDQCGHFH